MKELIALLKIHREINTDSDIIHISMGDYELGNSFWENSKKIIKLKWQKR